MKQDERHHTSDDFFVGIDLATRQHQVVVLDAQGCRLTSFKVPHSRQGLHELVERCTSPRVRRGRGEVHFAFEATGHVWEAGGAFFEQHALRYHVVNPLATFRVREARQMGRDKRDLTDAEQIAQLLRTGVVTQCQLFPANYMQRRRAWGEYHRLRRERGELVSVRAGLGPARGRDAMALCRRHGRVAPVAVRSTRRAEEVLGLCDRDGVDAPPCLPVALAPSGRLLAVLPSSSVGEESLSPNYPDASSRFRRWQLSGTEYLV